MERKEENKKNKAIRQRKIEHGETGRKEGKKEAKGRRKVKKERKT